MCPSIFGTKTSNFLSQQKQHRFLQAKVPTKSIFLNCKYPVHNYDDNDYDYDDNDNNINNNGNNNKYFEAAFWKQNLT